MYWLKQPWVQACLVVVGLIALMITFYLVGKQRGRMETSNEFQLRQAELLKQAQESIVKADISKRKAEEAFKYAERLKAQIASSTSQAIAKEAVIAAEHKKALELIDRRYEDELKKIDHEQSDCDRCIDLCVRVNSLSKYFGFEQVQCDSNRCSGYCAR